MIEQVFSDIYKLSIPLPNNPLKATNSYFIQGKERNLLVDTGFNCQESRQAMEKALQELAADMQTTDLFITHLHSDHAGLVSHLATPDTTVWMSATDAKIVGARGSSHWSMFSNFLYLSGLIASGIENTIDKHPGYKYATEVFDNFTTVNDGDVIDVGRYHFQCIETQGHTQGHICLYEPDYKILLSGDHILGKITPNITLWQLGRDVLGDYFNSLDKIARLEVDIVLPGHRHILTSCRGRIQELKDHHARRIEDIMKIMQQGKLNGTQVAQQMNWDLSYDKWEDFPWGQKLFATGEAMSHLYHLVVNEQLKLSIEDGIAFFE